MGAKNTLLFFCILASSNVNAMQCAEQPFEIMVDKARAIFVGEVVARKRIKSQPGRCWQSSSETSNCGSKVATFKVERIWKGSISENAKVFSEDACYCLGSYFEVGDKYLVFARQHSGLEADFKTNNICLGTRSLSNSTSQQLIKQLNEAYPFQVKGIEY